MLAEKKESVKKGSLLGNKEVSRYCRAFSDSSLIYDILKGVMKNKKRDKNKDRSRRQIHHGNISINSKEVGYVPIEGFEEDIEIQPHLLNTALHRDQVKILIHPKEKGKRFQGEVLSVLKRAKTEFVGILEKSNGFFFLIPDDKKMYRDIFVQKENAGVKSDGKKVLVKIISWQNPKKNPEGKVIKVLGQKGKHHVEMKSIILEKGFKAEFPSEVEKEAEVLKDRYSKKKEAYGQEIKKRKDFRGVATFTIDPKTAKDFDDAISVKDLGQEKYEIGIHIADVSFFVKEKSALDSEAQKRGTSVYLVDRTIPMLPEILSNDLCSLNPDEDKLSFSAVFKINKQGQVMDKWFGKTVIRSRKRFTYEEAQEIINQKKSSGRVKKEQFGEELTVLNKIAKKLREKRFQEGAIDFETDEVEFELDKNGVPLKIQKKERLDTHKLVEEFMLLANKKVAEHIYNKGEKTEEKKTGKGGLSIYRIHDTPDKEKIVDLSVYLRALGYEINLDRKEISSKDINAVLKKIEGKAYESLIKTAAIRAMAKAVYSTKNIGHFGLAFQYYTHFTSPIRRYPDLLVHRILEKNLAGQKIAGTQFSKLEAIAKDASEKEIAASEAERDSIKYKQVEYMKNHVGKTFEAIISGVTEWGIYVEEVNTRSEGMIRLSAMADDFYILDRKNYAVVGEKTKKKYSLGDKVKVRLEKADLDSRTLDFVFV